MLRHFAVTRASHRLKAPFRISRGVRTAAEVVVASISQGGATGRGEAVPYARYGETVEGVLAQMEAQRALIEQGGDRRALAAALGPGAARNALDCALWDLEARLSQTSVAQLAGLPAPRPLASAITIGLDEPAAMEDAARKVASAPLLKVKVDALAPEDQIAAVRTAAPASRLIVDPNESWSPELLERLQPRLVELRVDLLEQPLPASDDAALVHLRCEVPLCADEAVHVSDDLVGLVERYDYVNVKLDKTGGLTEALALVAQAKAQGFGLMVGCMLSSSLSIAPAMLIAGGASFVDLDGPLWLAQDAQGGVVDHDGVLMPPAPGFWGDHVDSGSDGPGQAS